MRRRGRCVGRRLANCELHRGNLLHLVDDDFLRDPPKLLVLAVAQLDHGHVDGALMMRVHHGNEVAIDVAGRLRRHVVHHLGHRRVVLFQERGFLGAQPCRRIGRMGFVSKQLRRSRKSYEQPGAEDRRGKSSPRKLCGKRRDNARE
jgi:hypothetical protein